VQVAIDVGDVQQPLQEVGSDVALSLELLNRRLRRRLQFFGGHQLDPFFFARFLLIGCSRFGASAFARSASSSSRCCSASYTDIGMILPSGPIALPLRARRSSRARAASDPGVGISRMTMNC